MSHELYRTLTSLVILIAICQPLLVYGLITEQEKALQETSKLNDQNQQTVQELEKYFAANPPPTKQKTKEQILSEYEQYKKETSTTNQSPLSTTEPFAYWVVFIFILIIAVGLAVSNARRSRRIPWIPFTESTKDIVRQRQNNTCAKCGNEPDRWNWSFIIKEGEMILVYQIVLVYVLTAMML